MHPHGVFYDKASEGAPYNDNDARTRNVAVPPAGTKTYIWQVPERAGPLSGEPSSKVWLYHSHVDEYNDVNTGLVGAMVITRRGMARRDGSPKDVDREFVTMFIIFDESRSWYLDKNIEMYAQDPKTLKQGGRRHHTSRWYRFNYRAREGLLFHQSQVLDQRLLYANGPMMTMKQASASAGI